ncbi:DUF6294 family protein [Dyadobacter endophyticus]|uniref:DUF6294 family protein n=1 Tax=Dyadobacter TaxID=120831 RepID=UPI003CF6920D
MGVQAKVSGVTTEPITGRQYVIAYFGQITDNEGVMTIQTTSLMLYNTGEYKWICTIVSTKAKATWHQSFNLLDENKGYLGRLPDLEQEDLVYSPYIPTQVYNWQSQKHGFNSNLFKNIAWVELNFRTTHE